MKDLRDGRAVGDINAEIIRCDARGDDDPESSGRQAKSGRWAAFVRVIPYILRCNYRTQSRVRSAIAEKLGNDDERSVLEFGSGG